MNSMPKLFEKFGDVVRVGPNDILFGSKDGIQKILVEEDLAKAPVYSDVEVYKGVSNLITERDKAAYKAKRRLLSPGFSISYLNGLEPQMQACMREFEKYLDGEIAKGSGFAVIDMARMLSNLTFDVMSATSFGGSFNLVSSDDQKVKSAFLDRLKQAALDAQFPFLRYMPFMPPSINQKFNDMITDIVSKRRSEMSQKLEPTRDLLQLLIDTHNTDPVSFTDLHMREEMALFMIAGSDTSSMTLTCTLLLLVNNSEKLTKLINEIDEAFPDIKGDITFAKTQDLPFLNAVINESMRVMPIIRVGLARYTTETTIISSYEIPPETIVSACMPQVLLSPKIWPDAESFIPERWLAPYKGVEADKKAHLVFSAGSRNCPGQQFALKELRLALATLVRRYDLVLKEGQSHEMKVHTVPWFVQGGYWVGVRRREV